MSSPQGGEAKFEEDILPPFISKFSNSNSLKSQTAPDLNDVRKVTALFPGLAGLNMGGDVAIKTVNGFTAVEVDRKLCKFQFGGKPNLKASLSFWYLKPDEMGWPLVCEFSFDYDATGGGGTDNLEQYPSAAAEGANRLFAALQSQAGWFNPNGTTKTAFALEAL